MISRRTAAWLILLPFTALTLMALWQWGVIGIFTHQFQNSAGIQVFVDLVIALLLVFVWLVPDAKAAGRNPLPWLFVTLATGSFGPLLYLATEKKSKPLFS